MHKQLDFSHQNSHFETLSTKLNLSQRPKGSGINSVKTSVKVRAWTRGLRIGVSGFGHVWMLSFRCQCLGIFKARTVVSLSGGPFRPRTQIPAGPVDVLQQRHPQVR